MGGLLIRSSVLLCTEKLAPSRCRYRWNNENNLSKVTRNSNSRLYSRRYSSPISPIDPAFAFLAASRLREASFLDAPTRSFCKYLVRSNGFEFSSLFSNQRNPWVFYYDPRGFSRFSLVFSVSCVHLLAATLLTHTHTHTTHHSYSTRW